MAFVFLFIALAVLFFSHWAVYCFFIRVFRVQDKKEKTIWRVILLILSLSFIASSLIAHWQENILTKFFYIISWLWPGLLVNLLLAIGIYWVAVLIFRALKIKLNAIFIGRIAIIMAIFYTCFGIFNVFFPRVKSITVKIDNLPTEWQGKTIIQLSDLHLGRVLGKGFLERIVNKVNNLNPEAVAITGDLFDGMDGELSLFVEPLNNIKSAQGAYYVTGNHETYLGVSEVLSVLEQTEINVLDDKIAEINGLQIIGVSYPDFDGDKDIKKIIQSDENFNLNKPSILLYHSPTNIFSTWSNGDDSHGDIYWPSDVNFTIAKELGIDLQLSGHTHHGQIFPFGFITKLIYGNYDYGLHGKDGFAIYITSGTGIWGPIMRTGSRSEIVVITLQ